MKNIVTELPTLFRELDTEEEEDFKQWARDNWSVDQKVNPVWHPVVVEECATILDNYIREHTKLLPVQQGLILEYDGGALEWNFTYKDQIVALDSFDVVSEEQQFEMAVEHFWEMEWEERTNGKS
jgi:hypothetical protein